MKNFKRFAALVLAFAFFAMSFNFVASAASVKVPKVSFAAQVKTSANVFDLIPVSVKANYSGKVQYRAYIVDEATKKTYDIFGGNGYSAAVDGNKVFSFNAKIAKPGKYHITIMVKRDGSKVKYDTYVKTKTIVVKDVKLSLKSIDVLVNGTMVVKPKVNGNAFIFDLSAMKDSDRVTHLNLMANKNSNVNLSGNIVRVAGNVKKTVTPKQFGLDKNPPEGVTLGSLRSLTEGNSLGINFYVYEGKEKVNYAVVVKIR
ncbi:hypothetical protein ABG79_00759 [Caloramator mitchellensis]|uniref:Uncharacterized protein n=1 Tax=Caloramator mitchellensis TaxID=908809 RepID=A0A0R3JYN9_CALMK|nr:hypothetical protein [Caloramator mitchellensis]KRQ87421.1 hypothetical protein ABG79_00759 [Caloramator mitchellensis]